MTLSLAIKYSVFVFLLLGSFPSSGSGTVRCPPPFFFFKSECFYFYLHEAKTWHDARAVCKSMGGDLAEPRDFKAFFSLKREIAGDVRIIWLGVSDEVLEGQWVGLSGRQYYERAIPWSPGEPNNAEGMDHYLNIVEYGYNDDGAAKELNFACEYQLY